VVAVPTRYIVTDAPCVIVWLPELLLKIDTTSPELKTLAGTVTPPVVILMYLPTSPATSV
jgi:hypothetical protein